MPGIDLIAAFVSAARHASFAGAARDMGLSPSAVAKNVTRLEQALGVRLFQRTTRQISLSPDGQEILDHCTRIMEDMAALEAAAAGARADVRGTLRIDMPAIYGHRIVLPVLAQLAHRYPQLKLDARFSDQVVDIVKEGLDAAIRVGPLTDSRLVGREFDRQVIWTCASPDYLARRGTPAKPEDLASHACLRFRMPSSGRDRPWQFRAGRRDLTLAPDGGLQLGDGEALVRAAAAGLGIVQVPDYMAAPLVEAGELVEILGAFRPLPAPISLVYPSHRQVPPRVRVLLEGLLMAQARHRD